MKKIFLLMLLLFPVSVAAQTAAFNGYCTLGSTPAITSGLPSSNLNQGLIPQCQVSVYLTGTVNLAAIYADATNTPLTNPFTASTKAQWLFFAATGQGYDVVMNGGFPPLVYTVPVTLTDLSVPTGGGSAGCTTSGIAGTLVASNGTGGCQPAQVEVNSAPLATPSPINFTNTPSITVANPGTGVIQLTGAALKTDGSANSLQNLLNFIDTSTIQFTNPSGGIESATCVTSTVSVIGCMKPDGTTISISSGIITAITATSSTLGIVKPDNTTVTISGGVLSAAAQSALIIQAEDVTLGGKFAAGSGQTLDFNSTLPAPPGGNLNVTFQNDPATGRLSAYVPSTATPAIQPVIIPPISGQYVILYPTTITTCSNTEPGRGTIGCAAGSTGLVNGSSPSLGMVLNKFPSSFPPIDMSGTLSGFSLPSYINPANVTAVYGFAVTEMANPSGPGLQPSYCGTSGSSVLPSGGITNWSARQVNILTGLVGSTISTASCHFEWVNSGADPLGASIFGVQAMGLIVYYTGTAPPVNNNLLVQWPLTVNFATNSPNATLSIDPLFPYWTNVLKVSDLGVQANTGPYTITPIRDGATTTDCSAGGGANFVLCTSTDGVTYTALGTGGGLVTSVGNSDGTLTISPTTGSVVASLNLGHVNTWTQLQTFSQGIDLIGSGAPLEVNTAPGTIGQCLVSNGAAATPSWGTCGSGSPISGSGTGGYYSLWQGSGASVTLGNGHVDDSVTHAGIITSTLPVELTTSHDGGTLIFDEAFPFSPASGKDILYGDSASHCLMYSANGGSFACLGSGGGSGTVTDSSGTTTANQLALSTTTTHQIQYSTAIPNGTTATTQTTGDNTTKVATDAFVLANAGGGGTSPGIFPIDSYGGVGDGNLSANTGTDNTSAFASALAAAVSNSGGTITFDCGKQYRFLTTGPTITTSSISLQGSCPGAAAATYSSLAGAATTIFTSSASATVVDFHGTSTTATITNNSIHNISISRAVPPGSGAIGLNVHFTTGFTSNQVTINDSATGIDGTFDPSFTGSGFLNTNIVWGWSGVAQGTGPYICFNGLGAGSGYSSMILSNVGCNKNPATITSTTTYGFKGSGVLQDLNVYYLGTAFVDYPIYLSGTVGQDVHFISPTLDNVGLTNYIAVAGNSITISDWWATVSTAATTSAWELNGASGVSLLDGQCFVKENIPCIYEHASSSQNIFNSNRFHLGAGGSAVGQGILVNNSSAVIIGNNFDGNSESGYTLPWLSFVSANYSTVQGNSFSAGTGVAIKADASSTYNCCINPPPASNSAVTLTITDLGTNNESLYSGTTGSIGGSLLSAGACSTGTVSISGITTGQVATATASTSGAPGTGNYVQAQVTSAGTVTVSVCAAIAGTPTASTYLVRVQ